MTISNSTRTAGPFVGNGFITEFPFAYKVFDRADVLVAVTTTATGAETILTLDLHYTVILNPNQNANPGGVIRLTAPLAVGTTLAATSAVAMTQNLELTNNGGFYPRAVNDALDRIVIQIQQLSARLGLGALNVGAAATIAAVLGFIDRIASSTGSSLVGFLQHGIGAVLRTLQDKGRDTIHVKDYGAKGDGVTDDTLAIKAAADALKSGQTLHFGDGTYLVSYKGAAYASAYGNVIVDLVNKTDITIMGEGATIKVVNHDITAKGGLRFANFKGCKRVRISGLFFDMTFLGSNSSALFYPFCGAITALDDDAAAPAFSTLNSDFKIEGCTFKLYHPSGNWQTSANPYQGDNNNGYKLYSIFVSGPYTPTEYENQCRNIEVTGCTWLKGHNGYGIWFWSWNNCRVTSCVAEDWVTKYSGNNGAYAGGGVAWIRHIPFRTAGIVISGNNFRAKPTAERGGAYAGISQFYVHANNIGATNLAKGESVVSGNTVIIGAGGNGSLDEVIFFNGFGSLVVANNTIDGHEGTIAGDGALVLNYSPGDTGGQGDSSLLFTGNHIGRAYFGSGIFFVNGSNESEANRRCKHLVVTCNTMERGDFFLRMTGYNYRAHEGVRYALIANNVIDGGVGAMFPPPSGNNYGVFVAASHPDDTVLITGNTFANHTESVLSPAYSTNANAKIRWWGNTYTNINVPYNAAANLFPSEKWLAGVQSLALSGSDADVQPFISLTNTSGPAEVKLFQQATISYMMATSRISYYLGGVDSYLLSATTFRPATDNTKALGDGAWRFSVLYAGSGSINTSDERAKQQIQAIDARVLRAWGKVAYAQYKFNDAVETKGDGARWHFGVIAQRVKAAFESEGLDPFAYGLLCFDQWADQYTPVLDKDGNPTNEQVLTQEAGNRYGIRYEEALALECAYLRSKLPT